MQSFKISPHIHLAASCGEFCQEFQVGEGDLLFASRRTQEHYLQGLGQGAIRVDYRDFGTGEPTDKMVEGIAAALAGQEYKRVIAIGGGTILDVAKLFALQQLLPIDRLFQQEIQPRKKCELVLVPTTCGTGSEMTNISILSLTSLSTKMGLDHDALYADHAVLIPELLQGLPDKAFGASAIDALIHAMESFTSPRATAFTQMFSLQAMDWIIRGFQDMAAQGKAAREKHLEKFLLASAYAGIAFGNAGCAAVHALSYPLGAAKHVPHGEANAVMLLPVYRLYQEKRYDGSLRELCQHLAMLLDCPETTVWSRLEELLSVILNWKKLSGYGVTEAELADFAAVVMTKQKRLMANNYVTLTRADVDRIYKELC
ncbi:4-hydroxybutyrate dehydrogenase [Selenomonas ruminantium]|uniref:4-hydroxybutyrate dehydrogenase n=1 Tax=Selenomonas ruminantium TaxID=971 RepID=A0A1H0NMD9_SELRU|nr:4-hydroxybutyrate dehydrogenase [Selenomonas ruminantium]SDO93839.1 4-hydroxybutyrate dehydrogenase [Selenomonas ruminantium]